MRKPHWLHVDDDGAPWMMISLDVLNDHGIVAVLRADYDDTGVIAGHGPACLNWDGGVRARNAGITVESGAKEFALADDLVDRLADWFEQRNAETGWCTTGLT